LQLEYNTKHGITPETIVKAIRRGIEEEMQAKDEVRKAVGRDEQTEATEEFIQALEAEMLKAAEDLEFERAAALRDRIMEFRNQQTGGSPRSSASPQATSARAKAKAGGKKTQRRPKPL
jgi:excinuclease ABC subunit B